MQTHTKAYKLIVKQLFLLSCFLLLALLQQQQLWRKQQQQCSDKSLFCVAPSRPTKTQHFHHLVQPEMRRMHWIGNERIRKMVAGCFFSFLFNHFLYFALYTLCCCNYAFFSHSGINKSLYLLLLLFLLLQRSNSEWISLWKVMTFKGRGFLIPLGSFS